MSDTTETDAPLEIPAADVQAWVSLLQPFQSKTLNELLGAGNTPEQVVELWLGANGPGTTAGFGGDGQSRPFRTRFMEELKKFVCGDKQYAKDRTALQGKLSSANTVVISTISVAIAATLGVTAAVLVPVVALLLGVIGKIGVHAWCGTGEACPRPDEKKSG